MARDYGGDDCLTYKTLKVSQEGPCCTIQFNRPEFQNAINSTLISDIHCALDAAEEDPCCRAIILSGADGIFCTGMDLDEIVRDSGRANNWSDREFTQQYSRLLNRFSTTSKYIIAKVDGQVVAGGVGFVAASDLVIATPRSRFSLSEALWGLLPSMVVPYLIRKTGFQVAYRMTLTTLPIDADEACRVKLVDNVSDESEKIIDGYLQRLVRIEERTVSEIKSYFRSIWVITDEMEKFSASETERLMSAPEVIGNISNYVKFKRFPWDKDSAWN